MTDGYARAEKEFLDPPDDEVGECDDCGGIDVLGFYDDKSLCDLCWRVARERPANDDEDDELFTPEDLDHD